MYLKKYNLKNKTAVVTGAGKGLGKACAIALAEAGVNLVIISRTQKDLDNVSQVALKDFQKLYYFILIFKMCTFPIYLDARFF